MGIGKYYRQFVNAHTGSDLPVEDVAKEVVWSMPEFTEQHIFEFISHPYNIEEEPSDGKVDYMGAFGSALLDRMRNDRENFILVFDGATANYV
jgi:hypothetical protein